MKQAFFSALRHSFPINSHSDNAERNSYMARVHEAVAAGLQDEFNQKLALRLEANDAGWNARIRKRYKAATFTAHDLALRVDKVSLSKLTRELKKLSAPPPGRLIRNARIDLAKHLLHSTRLLIRDIAEASGYDFEKHFSAAFHRSTGMSPSEFRRRSITSHPQE